MSGVWRNQDIFGGSRNPGFDVDFDTRAEQDVNLRDRNTSINRVQVINSGNSRIDLNIRIDSESRARVRARSDQDQDQDQNQEFGF